jgi:hypothetical protein
MPGHEPRPPAGKRKLPRAHEPFARLSISLPTRQLQMLRSDAAELGISISELIRRIVDLPSSRIARTLSV